MQVKAEATTPQLKATFCKSYRAVLGHILGEASLMLMLRTCFRFPGGNLIHACAQSSVHMRCASRNSSLVVVFNDEAEIPSELC
jgi:hypothetical protein